jgi:hypothetical protein
VDCDYNIEGRGVNASNSAIRLSNLGGLGVLGGSIAFLQANQCPAQILTQNFLDIARRHTDNYYR